MSTPFRNVRVPNRGGTWARDDPPGPARPLGEPPAQPLVVGPLVPHLREQDPPPAGVAVHLGLLALGVGVGPRPLPPAGRPPAPRGGPPRPAPPGAGPAPGRRRGPPRPARAGRRCGALPAPAGGPPPCPSGPRASQTLHDTLESNGGPGGGGSPGGARRGG